MKRAFYIITGISVLSLLISVSCRRDEVHRKYITENVIVVVIDGPRYTETWGDPSHQHIPFMADSLAPSGVVYSDFRNNGPTYTNAGHTALLTGVYQSINNSGGEKPENPNFVQAFIKKHRADSTVAKFVTSKDKIQILGDTEAARWKGKYQPTYDCGNNGLGTGYRHDSITHERVMQTLEEDKPRLLFINYREPDWSGHANNWDNYIKGIENTDRYAYEIWKFIRSDSFYAGKTTLFVTNDHGRHIDGHKDGFRSHGDECEGCRMINCFAYGPDFREGLECAVPREQIDIPTTISELFDLKMGRSDGSVMWELFRE